MFFVIPGLCWAGHLGVVGAGLALVGAGVGLGRLTALRSRWWR
jgi:hypothetical protein